MVTEMVNLDRRCLLFALLFLAPVVSSSFVATPSAQPTAWGVVKRSNARHQTKSFLFDKVFEEEGPLGKGITVGKVQVALTATDRGRDSIFGLLEEHASNPDDTPEGLAEMCSEVCLDLLRKQVDWISAASDSKWFKTDDYGKAESQFNDWANAEAAKFEKEYIPDADSDVEAGGATQIVVSIIIEIEGDATKFDGAGFSMSGTKDVLNSIASDCMVDYGQVTRAVEVFWTPGDRKEVLTPTDLIVDFPELVTL